MKSPFHVNLLLPEERVSSSPVRPRVLVPALAVLAALGMLVWWGTLFGQLSLVRAQLDVVKNRILGGRSAHDAVLENMRLAQERTAELSQLQFYRSGRRTYGDELAAFAATMPESMQLVSMSVPPPPPQNLRNPKNPKAPPLLGPTGTVETVSFRFVGRTASEASTVAFLDSLGAPVFTNMLVVSRTPEKGPVSPRIHSFRQEPGRNGTSQSLALDVEFRCRERRFEK